MVSVPSAAPSPSSARPSSSRSESIRRRTPCPRLCQGPASYNRPSVHLRPLADIVDRLIRGLFRRGTKPQEFAFFAQHDAYGDSGFAGAVRAINEAGFQGTNSLVHERDDRGTLAVERGVMAPVEARVRPKAVILAGTYAANAWFIKLARQILPAALGADGEGVIIGHPQPEDRSLRLVAL
jgi:hypothetical protein